MEKCPKCGGTSGFQDYHYKAIFLNFNWGGEEINGEEGADVIDSKFVYCLDCSKKFNKKILLKKINDKKTNKKLEG